MQEMIRYEQGALVLAECLAEDLAAEYGTPTLVISEDVIRSQIQALKVQFLDRYPRVRAAYAAKAFLPKAMCRIVHEEGLGLDVVSGGELFTALEAGFPTEFIEFNGNNKSIEEIHMAVSSGVGRIILDSPDEWMLVRDACRAEGRKIKALLRVSPGIDSHTHAFISTGNVDSKFGIPLHGGVFEQVFRDVLQTREIDLLGFHFHIGSQIHDNEGYLKAVEVVLDLIEKTRDSHGFVCRELNIGGGFGVRYTDADDAMPFSYFLDPVMEALENGCRKRGLARPELVIEPGRSLVANAGVTIYRVGAVKDIPGIKTYASVDGGMTDNIRTALYGSLYEVYPGIEGCGSLSAVTLCGKCCESGDILVHDALLPKLRRGDLVAIAGTGAYCLPMASNYNKIPQLAVVMVSQGAPKLIVARQNYRELIARELP